MLLGECYALFESPGKLVTYQYLKLKAIPYFLVVENAKWYDI